MSDPSKTYRQPRVEDDDDDDLDDLDASFNTSKQKTLPSQTPTQLPTSASGPSSSQASRSTAGPPPNEQADPEFDAALMEGMESLLRQLAGNAGIMPDLPAGAGPGAAGSGSGAAGAGDKGKEKAMSAEEEEAAWQKALESVLSGEGLRAMGLDDLAMPAPGSSTSASDLNPPKTSAPVATTTAPSSAAPGAPPKPSFDDTIRRTLDSLKSGGSGPAGGAGSASASAGLEEFLRQMGHDPSALDALNGLEGLDGLDGLDGDDDLGGILDGMMSQLMNKEILEEPMAELEAKYPAYLASPPPSTPPADLEKYKQQHALVKQILATFRKPSYSDAEDSKEIARLVGEMQDLGGPPKEIMGDMPEGFDLNALGGEEGCSIM